MKERSKLSKITAVVLALSVVAGAATGIISNALASGVPSLDYIGRVQLSRYLKLPLTRPRVQWVITQRGMSPFPAGSQP